MRGQVTMNDFLMAFKEVKPAFGAVTETLNQYRLNGIIDWGPGFRHLATTCKTLTEQVRLLPSTRRLRLSMVVILGTAYSDRACQVRRVSSTCQGLENLAWPGILHVSQPACRCCGMASAW